MKLLSTAVLCLSLCTVSSQKTKLEMIHEKCPLMNSATNAAPAPTAQPDPGIMHRGEMGMGFSQTATTHHFLLLPDGGVIQVEANDPSDADSLASIRMHLHHIAGRSSRAISISPCLSTTPCRPVCGNEAPAANSALFNRRIRDRWPREHSQR